MRGIEADARVQESPLAVRAALAGAPQVDDQHGLAQPLAVSERLGRQEKVVLANAAAQRLGVHAGLRRSAAQALAPDLRLLARQPEQEAALLETLACWAMQFSPAVSLHPPQGVLIEIEGCLRYFGGLSCLCAQIAKGMPGLTLQTRAALAPTPLAAAWLARFARAGKLNAPGNWRRRLLALPLAQLPWPAEIRANLDELGLRRLSELLDLPRDGLALRLGPDWLTQLDRALGAIPDPQTAFTAPDHFARSIELGWPAEQVEALGFVARRLLQELAAFLLGRGLGVQQVVLQLVHERSQQTQIRIGFGKPTRSADAMLAIVRERLQREQLAAPVRSLGLRADTLHRLDSSPISLLGNGRDEADLDLLLARLTARLGEGAVRSLACAADHRPEYAWRNASTLPERTPLAPRPAWLLPAPLALNTRDERPWHGEPLTLLTRAERIESGWWDGDSASRDYFQAEGPSGRRYWLYRQRSDGGWFLHGLFA